MHSHPAPQELRTFFVTFATAGRRSLFQVDRNATLLMEIFRSDRAKRRYELHAWVAMPDHIPLLLTPAPSISLEKAIQFVKGGFSFGLKSAGEIWERGFRENRVKEAADFAQHLAYIEENPVRERLADSACRYMWSGAFQRESVDPVPEWFLESARG